MDLPLISLNIGLPRVIGMIDGEAVLSGIAKEPVLGPPVQVGRLNIEGDGQADLSVHGGADKAVYAYSTVNWPWWQVAHGLACVPGTMGENLTLEGASEDDVAIGDWFRWGEALLEISQPRAPCFKLAIHTRRQDVPGLMTVSSRCGWYYRVIEEGRAEVHGTLTREHASGGPTVRETFRALFDPRFAKDRCAEISVLPALAEAWRRGLRKRLLARP